MCLDPIQIAVQRRSRYGRWTSRLSHLARHIEKPVHQDVGARSDADGPIPPEPPTRVLVGRGGAHHAGQECLALAKWTHRQRVDGFRVARLGKVAERLWRDARELN